jgi:hypothetical protein
MFPPGDPRIDEILELAEHAKGRGLLDRQRPKWRVLVTELLGSIHKASGTQGSERRVDLRANVEIVVNITAPAELASLATSTVGSGGISIRIAEEIPVGTPLELSMELKQRPTPIRAKAQVVWSRAGEMGAAFTDIFQGDRELLEAVAVRALLRAAGDVASADAPS